MRVWVAKNILSISLAFRYPSKPEFCAEIIIPFSTTFWRNYGLKFYGSTELNTNIRNIKLRWKLCSWKVTSVAKLKNKYIVRSRISEKKFREILWYFSSDIEAVKIAEFTNISEKTINKITKNIRILMSKECEKISKFSGEISSSQARLEASLYINLPAAPFRLFWNRQKLLQS